MSGTMLGFKSDGIAATAAGDLRQHLCLLFLKCCCQEPTLSLSPCVVQANFNRRGFFILIFVVSG